MSSKIKSLGVFLLTTLVGFVQAQSGPAADPRIESLLSQMTLDEKIGQMTQPDVHALKEQADIQKYFLGSILNGGGGGPANNVPQNWIKVVNDYESWRSEEHTSELQ